MHSESIVTTQRYERLVDQIIPAIQNTFPNNFEEIWFQHDGALAHFVGLRRILNETFPLRWIGRNEEGEDWPPRSPDLITDYYLWGYLKSKVYRTTLKASTN